MKIHLGFHFSSHSHRWLRPYISSQKGPVPKKSHQGRKVTADYMSFKPEGQTLYDLSDPLVLSGHYVLTVLKGAVEVGGTVIEASLRPITISCPITPFFAIKPARSFTQACFLPAHGDDNLSEKFKNSVTVIAVAPQKLNDLSKLAPPFKSLFPDLTQVYDRPEFTVYKSWKDQSSQIAAGQKVVLLGPKNSGKSSFARYLINQRVTKQQPVYYLDLDPGQCEFTPPGTLALCLITDFVFGPPYTHCGFESVVKAHTLGYPSPMDTPGRYLEMCADLYSTFLSHTTENPTTLIVNTPGWTKGLGLELNTEVCLTIGPDFMCHMGVDDAFEDFAAAASDACDHIVSVDQVDLSDTPSKFSAAELRVVQSMAYFHKTNPDHLTAWAPYELQYGAEGIYALAVLDSDGIDLAADIAVCVEGTIVAINVTDSPPPVSELSTDIPFISPEDSMALHKETECIGYAVIQSMTAEWIRLLTPLETTAIQNKKVILTRGRLKLPIWELWDQKATSAPWLSSKAAGGLGGSQLKFRRNLQRR